VVVDENGNVTVTLSKFSNYFLMAAPPRTDTARAQTVGESSSVSAETSPPSGAAAAPPANSGGFITDSSAVATTPARAQQVVPVPEANQLPGDSSQPEENLLPAEPNETVTPVSPAMPVVPAEPAAPVSPSVPASAGEPERKERSNTLFVVLAIAGAGLIGGITTIIMKKRKKA
jgi:hypothetical protein